MLTGNLGEIGRFQVRRQEEGQDRVVALLVRHLGLAVEDGLFHFFIRQVCQLQAVIERFQVGRPDQRIVFNGVSFAVGHGPGRRVEPCDGGAGPEGAAVGGDEVGQGVDQLSVPPRG